jgi:hypothetical protein
MLSWGFLLLDAAIALLCLRHVLAPLRGRDSERDRAAGVRRPPGPSAAPEPGEPAVTLRERRVGLRRWLEGRLVVRVVGLYTAISGYDRALALATQAFVALVPMLIVVASALPDGSRAAAEGLLVDRLGSPGRPRPTSRSCCSAPRVPRNRSRCSG